MTVARGDDAGRRAPRLPTRVEASLLGRPPRRATVVEMSVTGCLVSCPKPLDRGAILDLEIDLEGKPFAAKVRVSQTSEEGGAPPGEPARYLAGLEFMA